MKYPLIDSSFLAFLGRTPFKRVYILVPIGICRLSLRYYDPNSEGLKVSLYPCMTKYMEIHIKVVHDILKRLLVSYDFEPVLRNLNGM